MKLRLSDYISIECWSNPLRSWWKARKYFRRPQIKVHFFSDYSLNCPFARYDYTAKIFHFMSADVMWKDKWNSPRHERNPLIWCCLFKKFGFSIAFHITYEDELCKERDGSMEYWEYMLDYLHYSKTLKDPGTWLCESKLHKLDGRPYRYVIPTANFSLNKEGKKKFAELHEIK